MKKLIFSLIIVSLLVTVAFPFKDVVQSSDFDYLQIVWTGLPTPNNPLPHTDFYDWEIPTGYTAVLECLIWQGRNEGNLIAFKGPCRVSGKLELGWAAIVPNDQGSRLFTERWNNMVHNNGARRWVLPLPEWNWSHSSDDSEEWLYSSIPPHGFSTGWVEAYLNGAWVDLKQSCNNALVVWNRSGERIQVRYKRSNPNDPHDRSLVTIYGSSNSLESIKNVYATQMGVPVSHLSVRQIPN
jgi:hypothetical protein